MTTTAVTTQTYDGSVGPGYPYNIPRRTAPAPAQLKRPAADGTPIYSGYVDEKKTEVKSFSFRPNAQTTGRVIYRDPEIRNTEYGFGNAPPLDVSSINRSEATVIGRNLKTWMRETGYTPALAEARPFSKILQAKVIGLAGGSLGFYYAGGFFLPGGNKRSLLIGSAIHGIICAYLMGYWIKPAPYIEMLQKNTPMGFKARQFLLEHRKQTEGLQRTNYFDKPLT